MSDEHANQAPRAWMVNTTLEFAVIPVSDVDRAKRFYGRSGLDADFTFDNTG